MSMTVAGIPQLRRRLNAVKASPRPILQKIQTDAVYNAKMLVPHKTGNLGRTIKRGDLTRAFTIVKATANYAAYVELGTKPHVIRPRNGKVLAWPASASGRKLSGAPRKGAAMRFARVVHHPGTKAHAFLVPGARKSVEDNLHANVVVREWNDAA